MSVSQRVFALPWVIRYKSRRGNIEFRQCGNRSSPAAAKIPCYAFELPRLSLYKKKSREEVNLGETGTCKSDLTG